MIKDVARNEYEVLKKVKDLGDVVLLEFQGYHSKCKILAGKPRPSKDGEYYIAVPVAKLSEFVSNVFSYQHFFHEKMEKGKVIK